MKAVKFMRLAAPHRWKRTLLNLAVFVYFSLWAFALFNGQSRVIVDMSPKITNKLFLAGYCTIDYESLGIENLALLDVPELKEIEEKNTAVIPGGKWTPKDCTPWQKIAIIIPYRDRMDHLKILLNHLHPFLQKQNRYYQIFVVEQDGQEKFNRGRLLNIGVNEALKVEKFDCFVFQDVDLLPEHSKNVYYCDENARHLASAIDETRYHAMYYSYAGGVISINRENFFLVNGYANDYWGWGNEDDDFSARTREAGLKLSRPPEHIGRFKMVRHTKAWRAENGYELFRTWKSRWKTDGIKNIDEKYEVVDKQEHKLYTLLKVDIGKPPVKPPLDETAHVESLWWVVQYFFP